MQYGNIKVNIPLRKRHLSLIIDAYCLDYKEVLCS